MADIGFTNTMNNIVFSKEETNHLVQKIKTYFNDELSQDIGGFDAEFLIEFFGKEIGSHYYNRGLSDAQRLFSEKAEELSYLMQELEKPIT